MNRLNVYFLPVILMLAAIVCFYPALHILVQRWWVSEDYSHAFFVVPIIGYIVWQKRARFLECSASTVPGLFLVVASLLYYLVALQLQVPTLIFLSLIFFFLSSIVLIAGVRSVKHFLLPVLLMVMIIPIPNQILSAITGSLQLYISEGAEFVIRLFSVPMLREGNVLHLPNRSFQVVDACSGIRSLISMTTLSVIIGYFTLSLKFSKVVLFLAAFPVALLMNLLRVLAVVLLFHFFGLDLTEGTLHSAAGLLLFLAGLAMLFSFQRFLEKWEIAKNVRS